MLDHKRDTNIFTEYFAHVTSLDYFSAARYFILFY